MTGTRLALPRPGLCRHHYELQIAGLHHWIASSDPARAAAARLRTGLSLFARLGICTLRRRDPAPDDLAGSATLQRSAVGIRTSRGGPLTVKRCGAGIGCCPRAG